MRSNPLPTSNVLSGYETTHQDGHKAQQQCQGEMPEMPVGGRSLEHFSNNLITWVMLYVELEYC